MIWDIIKEQNADLPLINSRLCDILNVDYCREVLYMAIKYDKLFHLLIDKKITNAQLAEKAGVSANIITRLKRDQYISIESIEKLCRALNCCVDDILEFVNTEDNQNG